MVKIIIDRGSLSGDLIRRFETALAQMYSETDYQPGFFSDASREMIEAGLDWHSAILFGARMPLPPHRSLVAVGS